jgi:hypothetical protein
VNYMGWHSHQRNLISSTSTDCVTNWRGLADCLSSATLRAGPDDEAFAITGHVGGALSASRVAHRREQVSSLIIRGHMLSLIYADSRKLGAHMQASDGLPEKSRMKIGSRGSGAVAVLHSVAA